MAKVFDRPVPFFRRKLEAAGINGLGDVASIDDLGRIPTTVKQDLRDSEAEAPPFGEYRFVDMRNCVRLAQSTGTTGTPTLTLFTRQDIWVEYECAARAWWRFGLRPGMTITHAHPAYLYGGGTMLTGTYEYFGMLTIWVPPPDTDELAEEGIRMWLRVKPDIPFTGFSLPRYHEVATKMGLDPKKDLGLTTPSIPVGIGPLMTAGLECFCYLGGPCHEGGGGAHINEDYAHVQAIDPATGKEVPDGEWGNLVVTTFGRDNVLLRYDLEEACKIDRTPCSCGETTSRGWWGGRMSDLIVTQGKRFQVGEVELALRTVAELATPSVEYQVVKPRDGDAPLRVRVELGDGAGDAETARGRAATALKDRLGITAAVEVLPRGTLPRSGYKTARAVTE